MSSRVNLDIVPENESLETQTGGTSDTQTTPQNQASSQVETEESVASGSTKRKTIDRKPMGKRSNVWNHFDIYIRQRDGSSRAKCRHCPCDYAYKDSSNGTSTLNKHMTVCKNHPDRLLNNQPIIRFFNTNASYASQHANNKFDQAIVRTALATIIIIDELPFKFVENERFRRFMHVALPQFVVPSRSTVMRDCYKLYVDEKERMKEYFKKTKQRVCLTTDTWTSNQNITYISLTGHFVDENWKLRKMILNFIPSKGHTGDELGQVIESYLLDWGIENVFTITVDNAGSNDTTITYLRERFCAWRTAICGGKFLQMRCIAHIINLIVKDGLSDIAVSVERVRSSVRYMKQSPTRWKKFKDYAMSEKIDTQKVLSLDCPTRWNSVYIMLETALMFKDVFHKYSIYEKGYRVMFSPGGKHSKIGLPKPDDWNVVERLVTVLQHFYDVTVRVSGSSYVTSNNLLEEISDIDTLLKEWIFGDDYINLSVMASAMKLKFDKYWGSDGKINPLVFLATIFDPRHKMDYVSFIIDEMYGGEKGGEMSNLIIEILQEMFDEYRKLYAPQTSSSQSHGVSAGLGSHPSCPELATKRNRKEIRKNIYRRLQKEGGRGYESELELYLSESTINDEELDVLQWWKLNSPCFPILSRIARDLYSIPITTVASESAFSTGGRIVDDFRSSLTPRIVQALICAQDWFRNEPVQFVEEDYTIMEKLEQDLISKLGLEYTNIGD